MPNAEELQAVMRAYGGNIAKVASFFRKDRRQIYRWAQTLGLDLRALRADAGDDEPRAETLPPGRDDDGLH